MDGGTIYLYYCAMFTFRLKSAFRTYCEPDWFWDTRSRPLPDFDLWVVLDGAGKLVTPQGSFTLRAGDSFVLRQGEGYYGTHDPHAPLHVIAAHFDWLDDALPVFHHRLIALSFCIDLLDRLVTSLEQGSTTQAALWLDAVLTERARQVHARQKPTSELGRRIDRLCASIREAPAERWRVADLARSAHTSRHHFARVFKNQIGISPSDFIIQVRIDAAKSLLRSSSFSVGYIADHLGYRDVYFFSRQFKQVAEVSPLAYRQGYSP